MSTYLGGILFCEEGISKSSSEISEYSSTLIVDFSGNFLFKTSNGSSGMS